MYFVIKLYRTQSRDELIPNAYEPHNGPMGLTTFKWGFNKAREKGSLVEY